MRVGAIDIGTNAARLLIGEVLMENRTQFINKIHYVRIPIRLGEDVFESGCISPEKIKKFVDTMVIFQKICCLFEVEKIRACATSAMREAQNRMPVVEEIQQKTGIAIEIISGQQEADLIFSTFAMLGIHHHQSYIVVDVGGGSTEISLFMNGEKKIAQSFEIGTLRMLKNKVSEYAFDELSEWLHVNVPSTGCVFYATGGNINKAHKLLGGKYFQSVSFRQLEELKISLEKLTTRQRMKRYQLKADRADVLVPALDIYCRILRQLKCEQVFVPKIGLSDGIIYNLSVPTALL